MAVTAKSNVLFLLNENQSRLDKFVRNVRLADNLYLIKIQQIN
jgi:hypothetical protein